MDAPNPSTNFDQTSANVSLIELDTTSFRSCMEISKLDLEGIEIDARKEICSSLLASLSPQKNVSFRAIGSANIREKETVLMDNQVNENLKSSSYSY